MILFKKCPVREVKSYIYCVNQFLRKKRHKNRNQECKQNCPISSVFLISWSFDLYNSQKTMVTTSFWAWFLNISL